YKIIKFYAKSLQFPQYSADNLFRFEIKSKKSKYINSVGIYNLNDLLNSETYQELKSAVLSEFAEVLILDSTHEFENLNKRQKGILKDYLNSNIWYKTLQNPKSREFYKKRMRYLKLLDESGRNIHSDLMKIVSDKLEFLTIEKGTFLPIIIMGNCTHLDKRICPITGISLEQEKEGAKYIRTTTLKHLKEFNPETFDLLRLDLLKNSLDRPKFEKYEIKHLAKQIRNRFFNPNKHKQQGYHQREIPNQLGLF